MDQEAPLRFQAVSDWLGWTSSSTLAGLRNTNYSGWSGCWIGWIDGNGTSVVSCTILRSIDCNPFLVQPHWISQVYTNLNSAMAKRLCVVASKLHHHSVPFGCLAVAANSNQHLSNAWRHFQKLPATSSGSTLGCLLVLRRVVQYFKTQNSRMHQNNQESYLRSYALHPKFITRYYKKKQAVSISEMPYFLSSQVSRVLMAREWLPWLFQQTSSP